MFSKIKAMGQQLITGNAASGFFGIWQGRCTFFAIAFSAIGCYGWLVLNRDLTSFALFAGAIQALLVVRSASQDYHERQTQNARCDDNGKSNQPKE
jgi:hypothetical protein